MNLDVLWAACRNAAEQAAVTREAQRRFALIKWERDGGVQRAMMALHTTAARAARPDTLVNRVKFALEKHGPLASTELETILNEPILPNTLCQLRQQGEIEPAKEVRVDGRGHKRAMNIWRLAAPVCALLLLVGCARPASRSEPVAIALQRPAFAAPTESQAFGQAGVPAPTNQPIGLKFQIIPAPVAPASSYRVYFGAEAGNYTNSVITTNLDFSITNLAPRTRYYFAAAAVAGNFESGLTPEVSWPLPLTNYVTVAVTRRDTLHGPRTTLWSQTLTNPPGDSAFFETTIALTNNDVSVIRLNTSTLLVANTNQP